MYKKWRDIKRARRARRLLASSWWERILAGDSTAIPAEWEQGNGRLKFVGEQAEEFIRALTEHNVEVLIWPSDELHRAYDEYLGRRVE
jgi:hypothetical protein